MEIELSDDELFEGLESDKEPENEFDVSKLIRRIKKLDYKLIKQKEYKDNIERIISDGIKKTESAILELRQLVIDYMNYQNKHKLRFDDLGTISLLNVDKTDYKIKDEDKVIKYLVENDLNEFVNTKLSLKTKDLKDYLKSGVEIPGVELVNKELSLRIG